MQHVINKQVIELTLRQSDAAFRLQQQVSTQFYQQVLAILEQVFDALGGEGELISFDRLVIDMGAVPAEEIANGIWTDDLYDKLMEQAEAIIRDGGGRRSAVRRPRGAGIVEQWLSYMRTGHLPWNVVTIDQEWLELLLEHLAGDHGAVTAVREAIAGNPVVVRRMVFQHEVRFLVSLAEVLTAQNQSALPAALTELELIMRAVLEIGVYPADGTQVLRSGVDGKVIWMGTLRLAAEVGVVRASVDLVRALIGEVVSTPAAAVEVLGRLRGRLAFCTPLLEAVTGRREAQERGEREETRVVKVEPGGREVETRLLNDLLGVPDRKASGAADDSDINEGIFVPYAGLVLVHAFLNTFFSQVGLVKDGSFVDEAARERGVHLLQSLATIEAGPPEYELVLAKVLCAYPLEAPVTRDFEPTAAEMEEADVLLDVCLSQWTVLGNTSREGLRENFLQRNGRLYFKEGQLRLDVERSSIDVLLDYLPWNLSLVKLPWMKEILFVNWR